MESIWTIKAASIVGPENQIWCQFIKFDQECTESGPLIHHGYQIMGKMINFEAFSDRKQIMIERGWTLWLHLKNYSFIS